jgi:hypothetical protein
MDGQTLSWIYPEFFQTNRDYILHLQQICILLISATSIIFYNNKNINNWSFIIAISLSFICGITNLIVGLHLYSNFLGTILDFATKIPDLKQIGCWIKVQFTLDIINLFLIIASVFTIKNNWDTR